MLTIYGGRTRRLWPHLQETLSASRKEGLRCLVIVPDQYTLQAEYDLIIGMRVPGLFDVEITSFSNLVQHLFELYSAGTVRIDNSGKNVAIARAIQKASGSLQYYSSASKRRGFIEQSGAWISEMKQAQLDCDQLESYANDLPDNSYKEKICDLITLYRAYDNILAHHYVDGQDVLSRAIDAIAPSKIAEDSDIFVYGFDLINNDFAHFLCALSAHSHHVYVYLVMDREDAPDGDAFLTVRLNAERLRQYLRVEKQPHEWLWLEPSPLPAQADICHLERCLMMSSIKEYPDYPEHISLYEAATPYAEVQYVAQQVFLLLKKGISAKQICVLCGNLGVYATLLHETFQSYGIPHYLAIKEPLSAHGLVKFLLSALNCISDGYLREDVISILKSGYAPISQKECWILENYAERYGIKGKKWCMPFTRGTEEERLIPEAARQKLMEPIMAMHQQLRDAKNISESLQAPLDFLDRCDAYNTLVKQELDLLRNDMISSVLRTRQVWDKLMSLLDQLHAISEESRLPIKRLVELLEAGLLGNEIAAVPPSPDRIGIGQIGNLIPVEPYALFACGLDSSLNENENRDLLSDEEKENLGTALPAYNRMTQNDRDIMSELDIWKAFSSPTDFLYLSFSQAAQSGTAQRPASVVTTLRRMYPKMLILGGVAAAQEGLLPLAPLPALNEIGSRLRAGTLDGPWLKAWHALLQNEEYRNKALLLSDTQRASSIEPDLSPALAKRLFKDHIISASRLESYAACPYAHFVQHGLRPQEQKPWGLDSRDRGNFFHAAMENFTRTLPSNASWPHISRKECDSMMDAALKPLELYSEDMLNDSARINAEAKRYKNICKRIAWVFTKGAAQSAFRPSESEVAFGYPGGPPPIKLTLSDGSNVLVRGRIDRIDRFDSGESVYLRVVDYKSSEQTLDPAKIYLGMQLQLLLYLEAALENDPSSLPAGAFYQWMGDPLIDQEKKNAVESELAKRLCLKGVQLSDVQVLHWMDSAQPPTSIEDVFKKDGTPRKGKMVCTLEELYRLIEKAHSIAVKLTEEIRQGCIQVSPIIEKNNNSQCKWCSFAGVCRHDPTEAHDRIIPNISLSDLLSDKPFSSETEKETE